MFQADTDALRLDALDVFIRERTRQKGILGKIFKISAAQRVALDIDAGRQNDVDARFKAVIRKRRSHLAGALPAPGIGEDLDRRIGGRPLAELLPRFFVAAHLPKPDGPVA